MSTMNPRSAYALAALVGLGAARIGVDLIERDDDPHTYDYPPRERRVHGAIRHLAPRDHFTSEEPVSKRRKRRLRGKAGAA